MLLFALFVGLALAKRRDAQSHKRWMMLATIGLSTAAIARWPGVLELGPPAFFGLTDLFVIALGLWDWRSRRRLHAVTLWGGLLLVLSQPLRLVVSGTDTWLAFARWATGLLG
jgi:4-amino-4-deoxy-L-arabinose transferase-like glycosyltransferase